MKNNNRLTGFIPLLMTYVVVKIVHYYAGFEFDLFNEGVMNVKFLVDILSWGIVYAIIYFLLKRLLPQKEM